MNSSLNYNGNPHVKGDGVQQNFTAHEIVEYQRCMADPVYFTKTYVKIVHVDRGLVPFGLYPYQENMFNHFNDNRFSIVLAPRQVGKSASAIIYLLWYALFHSEKTIAILANKGATAREMLARITLALENIPFFLQPGTKVLNKGSIVFSNNSEILAAATSSSSIRGKSVALLMLDEFAFVENASTFYTATYPVIVSGKNTKVIVTSTPNGVGNMFHKLWEGAVQGTSDYKPFQVDWRDVPGRDEEWKRQTIANTSELQFDQEFNCSFLGSGSTLISSNCLLALQGIEAAKSQYGIKYYYDPVEDHDYIMTVDVSKGRGQDYSTFTVFDVSTMPFKTVCTYRDNLISPLIYPELIVRAAKQYNNAMVVIENNDAGQVVCNAVYYEYEYDNMFVSSAVKSNGIGVMMTKRVKRIGCSNLKDLIESGKLEVCDMDTIVELSTFEPHGDSYAARGSTHDDMVMNLVMFSWFVSTEAFGGISNVDLKQLLYSEKIREMDEDVPLFGIINNYVSDTPASSQYYEEALEQNREWNSL
jgi:hypothetical protein